YIGTNVAIVYCFTYRRAVQSGSMDTGKWFTDFEACDLFAEGCTHTIRCVSADIISRTFGKVFNGTLKASHSAGWILNNIIRQSRDPFSCPDEASGGDLCSSVVSNLHRSYSCRITQRDDRH